MFTYKTNPWGTHQPILSELLKCTSGNIIELGCGDCSTLLIKNIIKNSNRKLFSLESDEGWLNKYKYLEDTNHTLLHVPVEKSDDSYSKGKTWVNFIEEKLNNYIFEICFIDQSCWEARYETLKYFKNKCKFILVHDVDYFSRNKMFGTIVTTYKEKNKIKYDITYDDIIKSSYLFYPPLEYFAGPTGPPTLLCSNLLDQNELNNIVLTLDTNKYY